MAIDQTNENQSLLVNVLIWRYTVALFLRYNRDWGKAVRLTELKTRQKAVIKQVHHLVTLESEKDSIATRLMSLGFVPDEQVEIITRGIFGGEPILVKVGVSRFALRQSEADRIEINL